MFTSTNQKHEVKARFKGTKTALLSQREMLPLFTDKKINYISCGEFFHIAEEIFLQITRILERLWHIIQQSRLCTIVPTVA